MTLSTGVQLAPATTTSVRVLAVADSDSYLKWGASTLATLPDDATLDLVLLRSPILPSADQRAAAVAGTPFADADVPVLTPRALRAHLRATDPDVVLLSATGPVAELVVRLVERVGGDRRPALVGGLPGMSYPATLRALRFRAGQDAFVVHSLRERREFAAVAAQLGLDLPVVLAPLPFLAPGAPGAAVSSSAPRAPGATGLPVSSGEPGGSGTARASGTSSTSGTLRDGRTSPALSRVVFAPQAKMPVTRAHREQILHALARLAADQPDVDVVVKVRGLAGEAQTHHEAFPFDVLLADLVAAGDVPSGAVRVATGPLADQLGPGSALVTVSSTAALESLAAGIPTLVLEDFGVNERMLNAVFLGSGCLGTLDDLAAGRFGVPDPRWLADNYLHRAPSELPDAIGQLAEARRRGELTPPRTRRTRGVVLGRVRRRLLRTFVRSQAPQRLLVVLGLPGRVRRSLAASRSRAAGR